MGMVEVYNAVASYLDPVNSNIKYLGTVYPALPKTSSESDLFNFTPPGEGLGALIYMHISSKYDERIALGGEHDGRKFIPYSLNLLCSFKSDLPQAADGQAAFNEFIDSLDNYIRADRTAGCAADSNGPYAGSGVIFQWGEGGMVEGPDIRWTFPVPHSRDGGVMVFIGWCEISTVQILNT